jgi:hypothetical protein
MKKTIIGAVTALLLMTGSAFAGTMPLVGVYNSDNVPLCAGIGAQSAFAQNCTTTLRPMGVIYTTTAQVPTGTGTSAQVLATFSLPASTLDQTGRKLRIRAAYKAAANANNKTMSITFGSQTLTTGAVAANAVNAVLELVVTKSGASTQNIYGTAIWGTTVVTPFVASGTESDTAAITITATATDAVSSAADLTLIDFSIEYMN